MSRSVVVRYRTRADAADENQRLVERVFAELSAENPGGFHYASFRLEDRVTFIHIVTFDGQTNPLATSKAFAEFQRDIAERCVEQPDPSQATLIGSYRFD